MNDAQPLFTVVDVTIAKVEEQVLHAIPPSFLYPDLARGEFERVRPGLPADALEPSGKALVLSVHTWVVRTEHHLVLVDTGSGNGKDRPRTPMWYRQDHPYLDRLAGAVVDPLKVDIIINTHLHVDHAGWNTRREAGRWVPTFPNARYVFPAVERDSYASPASHNAVNVPSLGVFEDSVLPVIDAGLADVVGPDGGTVLDVFELIPTPGHSIGHMAAVLRSGGHEAIFAGDVMHTALQVARPDLNSVYCEFADQAVASRRTVLDRAARTGALYLAGHFPGPSAGFVTSGPGGYRWSDAR